MFVASTASGATIPSSSREELALRVEVLDDRLDHEVAAGEVGAVGRGAEAGQGGVALLRGEPPLLDAAAEVVSRSARGRARPSSSRRPRRRSSRRPAWAHTWAIPAPIVPSPTTPTVRISATAEYSHGGRGSASRPLLVAGEWVETGEWQEVNSPYSGEVVGRFAKAGADHARQAVDAAEAAMREPLPAHRRAEILDRVAHLLAEREDEVAETICAEAGKPMKAARIEAQRAVSTYDRLGRGRAHAWSAR